MCIRDRHKSGYGLSILQKLADLILLRRSKSMVITKSRLPLLGLKPFTLIFEPVPQDSSERGLYCFLEYLMHSIVPKSQQRVSLDLTDDGEGERKNNLREEKKLQGNKITFLRLLGELCLSPTLLNGGLGCPSQLEILNRFMKDYNLSLIHI